VTAPTSLLTPRPGNTGRHVRNRIATMGVWVALVVVVVPLVAVIGAVIVKGASSLSADFLTQDINKITNGQKLASAFAKVAGKRSTQDGIKPAIVGTLLITGFATLMAVPLGILGGVYLNEYGGKNQFARMLRFLTEVMTGVPSIVMGLFIFSIVVVKTGFSFGWNVSGFAGSLALGCLMLPVVIRATEEMLKLVPNELREASYALGARKSKTIVSVVSGALLAVARAAGETAPLVFVIGITRTTNTNIFSGGNVALSTEIFRNALSYGSYATARNRAWGEALVLIVIALTFTLLARLVTAMFTRRRAA
jgi:phosphate transport system permease protein